MCVGICIVIESFLHVAKLISPCLFLMILLMMYLLPFLRFPYLCNDYSGLCKNLLILLKGVQEKDLPNEALGVVALNLSDLHEISAPLDMLPLLPLNVRSP